MSNKLTCFAFVYVFALNGRAIEHKRESGLVRYAEIRCDTSFSSVNWQYLPMLKLSGFVKGLRRLKPWPITITRCASPFSFFCTFMSTLNSWQSHLIDLGTSLESSSRGGHLRHKASHLCCVRDVMSWKGITLGGCVWTFSRNIRSSDAWRRKRKEGKEDSPPVVSRFKTRWCKCEGNKLENISFTFSLLCRLKSWH